MISSFWSMANSSSVYEQHMQASFDTSTMCFILATDAVNLRFSSNVHTTHQCSTKISIHESTTSMVQCPLQKNRRRGTVTRVIELMVAADLWRNFLSGTMTFLGGNKALPPPNSIPPPHFRYLFCHLASKILTIYEFIFNRKWLFWLANSLLVQQQMANSQSLNNNCIVPNCVLLTGENKVSLFSVPQNSFIRWKELIPNVKFSSKSRVYSQHFEESDIKQGEYVLGNFYPYSRWRLTTGAEPKHFLGKFFFNVVITKCNLQVAMQNCLLNCLQNEERLWAMSLMFVIIHQHLPWFNKCPYL